MNKNLMVIVVVVIIVAAGGFFFLNLNKRSNLDSTKETQTVAANTIEIKNFAYSPKTIKVKPGQKIRVINRDIENHSVTSDDGSSFDSGILGKDQEAEITAPSQLGSYPFFCTPHPSIKGTLVVE